MNHSANTATELVSLLLHGNYLYVLYDDNGLYSIMKADVRNQLKRYEYLEQYKNLSKKKKSELRLLRNEIFARYGRKFKDN